MRVSHIITRLIVGGAQENTISSVLGLRTKPGVQVDLISGPSSGPEGSLEDRVTQHPGLLRIEPHLVRPVSPWHDWRALRGLTRTLRLLHPEIVHTHSGKAGVLGRIAAERANVPVIIHTIHGPSFGSFQGALANACFTTAERYAARFTTHFVVVANAMRDQYLAAGIGRPDMYTRVLSGFDLSPFLTGKRDPSLAKQLGIGPEDIVFGKIARLTALKGHDDLFAIAPELIRANPRLKFLLIGDGDLRPRLETLARESGCRERFVFAGLIDPGEVARYVALTDAVIHLSFREGLPRALPQALASGKPVIAYDCDGAREVCVPEQTGMLVPAGDRVQLQRALLDLAGNAQVRKRLGETGREFVRERFSSQAMVDALHALYGQLLVAGRPRTPRQPSAVPAVFC